MKLLGSVLLLFFVSACTLTDSPKPNSQDGFPDHWWLPAGEVASWEIPPQAARREAGEVVLSKRTELGKFSNLQAAAFELDGVRYASVEGLWQSMKYPEGPGDERLRDASIVWPYTRAEVTQLSGFAAKKAGDRANENMKKLGLRWVSYQGKKIEYNGADQAAHYDIILRACRAKVAADSSLQKLLLSTGDLKFLSDHKQGENPSPAYLYHKIYMKIRDELRAQSSVAN